MEWRKPCLGLGEMQAMVHNVHTELKIFVLRLLLKTMCNKEMETRKFL